MDQNLKFLLEKHKFKYDSILGKGGFGSVYSVYVGNSICALKVVNIYKNNKKKEILNKIIKAIENEFTITKVLRSKYCIRTIGIYRDENKLTDTLIYSLIMEKISYCDLKYFIYYLNYGNCFNINNNDKYLQNKFFNNNLFILKFFSKQIIQSIDFLYNHNLVHCDIKPENFLIDNGFILKISDFSVLKKIEKHKKIKLNSTTWNIKGPEYYTSLKEVDPNNGYKIDIFGFGLLLYYFLFQEHVLNDDNDKIFLNDKNNDIKEKNNYLYHKINETINKIRYDRLHYIDNELKELIISMIHPDINQRLNIRDLINNKWVNEDKNIINQIYNINDGEEMKIFFEFQKHNKNTNDNKSCIKDKKVMIHNNRKRIKNTFQKISLTKKV
jgi:serine/threonine protein kinase